MSFVPGGPLGVVTDVHRRSLLATSAQADLLNQARVIARIEDSEGPSPQIMSHSEYDRIYLRSLPFLRRVSGSAGSLDSVYALYCAPNELPERAPYTFPVSKFTRSWDVTREGLRNYLYSKGFPQLYVECLGYDKLFAAVYHGRQLSTYLNWDGRFYDLWHLYWIVPGSSVYGLPYVTSHFPYVTYPPNRFADSVPDPLPSQYDEDISPDLIAAPRLYEIDPPENAHDTASQASLRRNETCANYLRRRHFSRRPLLHAWWRSSDAGRLWATYHHSGLERILQGAMLFANDAFGVPPPAVHVWFQQFPCELRWPDGEFRSWRAEADRRASIPTFANDLLVALKRKVGSFPTAEAIEMLTLFRQARRGERPLVHVHPRVTDAINGRYPPGGGPGARHAERVFASPRLPTLVTDPTERARLINAYAAERNRLGTSTIEDLYDGVPYDGSPLNLNQEDYYFNPYIQRHNSYAFSYGYNLGNEYPRRAGEFHYPLDDRSGPPVPHDASLFRTVPHDYSLMERSRRALRHFRDIDRWNRFNIHRHTGWHPPAVTARLATDYESENSDDDEYDAGSEYYGDTDDSDGPASRRAESFNKKPRYV